MAPPSKKVEKVVEEPVSPWKPDPQTPEKLPQTTPDRLIHLTADRSSPTNRRLPSNRSLGNLGNSEELEKLRKELEVLKKELAQKDAKISDLAAASNSKGPSSSANGDEKIKQLQSQLESQKVVILLFYLFNFDSDCTGKRASRKNGYGKFKEIY